MRTRPDKALPSLLIAVAIVFLAAACGSQPPGPAAVQQAPAATQAPAQAAAPSSAEPVEITVWTPHPEMEPFYKAVVEKYNETHAPKIQLVLLSSSPREMEQKITASLPAGVGPDIFEVTLWVAGPFHEGGFLPANPPEVDAYLRANWPQSAVDYYTFGNNSVGLPIVQDTGAYFYNKKMFRDAGLDPDKVPETYDELMEYARKLTKYNSDGTIDVSGVSLRLSGQGAGVAEKFRYVLYNFGADFLVPAGDGKWRSGFDNEQGRAALQFYVDAVHKYKVDSLEAVHDAQAFVTEKTAMLARESWVIAEIAKKNPSLEYGTFSMPRQALPDRYTSMKPDGIFVSPSSKHPDIAWDLVKEITSAQNSALMTEMTGWVPVRKGVDFSGLIGKEPQWAPFVAPPPDVKPFPLPRTAVYNEVLSKVAELLTKAFADPTLVDNPEGIAKAVSEMNNLADQILKDNNLYGG